MKIPKIISINISTKKGISKTPVSKGSLKPNIGLEGDAHSNTLYRQLSLLAIESINNIQNYSLIIKPGDFAENITTQGIVLDTLPLGCHLRIGSAEIVITQIGKICHTKCAIQNLIKNCIMPKKGIFASVLTEGIIYPGDPIALLPYNAKNKG